MDSNWYAAQSGAATGPSSGVGSDSNANIDWRSQFKPDARQRIVNKIMATLKRHLPVPELEGINELQKIAVRFEENIYSAATSEADYLRKISLKMLSMETKTQPGLNPSLLNQNWMNPESMESSREAGSGPPPVSALPLHPAIAPLQFLLGRWSGEGEGSFPTIKSFRYGEELFFSHSGKPVIAYTQKTWKLESGEPMHAESGYWRLKADGSIEVVIAQSTGLVEVQKGSLDAEHQTIELKSELVGNASKVKEIRRAFKATDRELSYTVQMATAMTNLEPHLQAILSKI
jgi:hypothetical protein